MSALKGLVIIERAGRLAGAIGASLLAELGATVLRVEAPKLPAPPEPESWQNHPIALAGKTRLRLSEVTADAQQQWHDLLARADAVILSPPLPAADAPLPSGVIRCDISAFGGDGADGLPDDANEAILQAIGGVMSPTGTSDGPPEFVGAPLVEFFTGVNCAVAITAALRVRDAGGPAQRIDLSALDAAVALTGAYIGQMQNGAAHDLRAGSRHPLCCPWNAYRTRDGWTLMCSSTEPHWRRIAALIGRPELLDHPDFLDINIRKKNEEAVDTAINDWAVSKTTAEAVEAFEKAGIPVGPIVTIPDLLAADDAPPTRQVTLPNGTRLTCPAPLVVSSRTPSIAADAIAPLDDTDRTIAALPVKPALRGSQQGSLPLKGLRVVEVGVFTAGPLGTRYLADLGAEVIKVEQVGGESGRNWNPNFGGVSGYFATYNAGKRSVTLDLTQKEDQAALERLVDSADILLQNLKAGAMERMGFGPEETMRRHPSLIYVSVSGYGSKGARSPALDTVIQARSGLMSLIDTEDMPIKAGASVADLLASHVSPLGVLAALRHRDRTGEGQHIDISMRDALAWTTQLSWPDGTPSLPDCSRHACTDGWVVAQETDAAVNDALDGDKSADLTREQTIARLRNSDIAAARVLELDELFRLPLCEARHLFCLADTPGGTPAPVLAAPYGLTATAAHPGTTIKAPGADNKELIDENR